MNAADLAVYESKRKDTQRQQMFNNINSLVGKFKQYRTEKKIKEAGADLIGGANLEDVMKKYNLSPDETKTIVTHLATFKQYIQSGRIQKILDSPLTVNQEKQANAWGIAPGTFRTQGDYFYYEKMKKGSDFPVMKVTDPKTGLTKIVTKAVGNTGGTTPDIFNTRLNAKSKKDIATSNRTSIEGVAAKDRASREGIAAKKNALDLLKTGNKTKAETHKQELATAFSLIKQLNAAISGVSMMGIQLGAGKDKAIKNLKKQIYQYFSTRPYLIKETGVTPEQIKNLKNTGTATDIDQTTLASRRDAANKYLQKGGKGTYNQRTGNIELNGKVYDPTEIDFGFLGHGTPKLGLPVGDVTGTSNNTSTNTNPFEQLNNTSINTNPFKQASNSTSNATNPFEQASNATTNNMGSKNDIIKAFQSGKITREEAKSQLRALGY